MYIATAVVLLNVLAGGKGSRRRNQKLMINIVGFFSRYTYHSLLVVQGSISIAYWSSQPSVPQHTTTPPGPPLLPRCVFLLGLAAFGSVRSYIFDYTARRAGGQPCRAIASKLGTSKSRLLESVCVDGGPNTVSFSRS